MEKTSKILVDEHKNILKVADAIEKEFNELKKGKRINEDFFRKAVYFIKNYADKFHHAKEEDILFKEMLKDSVKEKMHCNPLDQMLHEHDIGRNFVKEILKGMDEKNRRKVMENAIGYVHLIREHISKEDNILYPMGDEVLSKKAQDIMFKKFEKEEKSREKEKKKCLEIVKEFEKRQTN